MNASMTCAAGQEIRLLSAEEINAVSGGRMPIGPTLPTNPGPREILRDVVNEVAGAVGAVLKMILQ